MESARVRIAGTTLISFILCVGFLLLPGSVAAQVSSVQTVQLLPPGDNTCAPLSAYSFTPYIYDGALHSFAFSIPDSSYVALAGSVGNTPISFQYMTRHGDAGGLRVHVDIQTTPLSSPLPLSVTLVSAGTGNQICMSVVLMSASGDSIGQVETPIPPAVLPTPIPEIVEPPMIEVPFVPTTPEETEGESTVTESTTTPPQAQEASSFAGIQNRIVEFCLENDTSRLWIVLVGVFGIVVAIATFGQLPPPQNYSLAQRVATILVPLILIAIFWYLSEACRTALWVPITIALTALLGLIGIFWDHPLFAPYAKQIKFFLFIEEETPKQNPKTHEQKLTPSPKPSTPAPTIQPKKTSWITPPPKNPNA